MRNVVRYLSRLLLGTVALAPLAASGHRPYAGPIVDVHVHVTGVTQDGDLDWYKPVPPNPFTGKPTRRFNDEDELLTYLFDELKRDHVVAAVVSNTLYHTGRALKAYPDMVVPAIALAPGAPYNYSVAQLREEIRAGRVKVLGEVFPQFYGRRLTDPMMEEYYSLAEEMDIPVGMHTGVAASASEIEASGLRTVYRGDYGNPEGLEAVLNRHPKLRIYLMHSGHPYFSETYALLQSYPNVYLDVAYISAMLPPAEFHRYMKRLFEAVPGLDKRLMFGSDAMVWREGIRASIDAVNALDFLSEAQKADVFCNNAARFFRLAPNPCSR